VTVFFGEGGVAQLSGDPLCERCHQAMEPVPPVGWICLGEHEPEAERPISPGVMKETRPG